MPFATGGNHGLRYVVESEFGKTPASPAMRELRHTSCGLALTKDSFQSNELRRDAQISDLRHGVKQANGDVGIELSYGEYDDFLAAAIRGEWDGNILKAGIKPWYFTIEREFADIQQFELFTGCMVNSLSLDIQSNAMVTGTISFIGKGVTFPTSTAATVSTPSFTHSPVDGFHGALKEGGAEIAVITSISLNIDNGIEAANVVGSDEAEALVPGRINCTGTVSAYFEDMTLLQKFVDEAESSLEIVLGDGGPGSYIFTLPRIKYTGGDNGVDGEGPVMLDMPFQALLDSCTGTNVLIERIPAEAEVAEPCVLTFAGTSFTGSVEDGSVATTQTVTLSGGNGKHFAGRNEVALGGVTFENVPDGLTAKAIRKSDTTAEISFTGTATAHDTTDSVSNVSVTFAAAAFEKGFCKCDGDTVTNGTQTLSITFEE